MKTQSKISKKLCLLFFVILTFSKINSQPVAYSWNDRHGFDYISDAKDQKEQGPCGIFATVAAVEAMVQIYFNTTGSDLDLSESNLYSECGLHNFPAPQALSFFKTNGVIDNSSWQFPTSIVNGIPYQYYLPSPACNAYSTYSLKAKIPQWGYSFEADSTLIINTNEDLKKAIMDYGPIIVMGSGANQNGDSLGLALHPGGPDVSHTVLITGWDSSNGLKWEIKDSWPGAISSRGLFDVNFFDYKPHFYCINPVYNDNGTLKYISVKNDSDSNVYTQSPAVDGDHDGFYRWGLDSYPPVGFTGCDKMDYDDSKPTIICRDGYDVLNAPYISDTSTIAARYICSAGRRFTLQNYSSLPAGFSVDWYLTPGSCFNTSFGSTAIADVAPISSYIGKKSKLEFNLYYTKGGNKILVHTYKWKFVINGPNEDLVSISVLDSYGGSAQGSDDYFYLCPNTNYTIYYNNADNSCSTSNFSWSLPYGWTENYHYDNYISINTNDYPYGLLQVNATTCCNSNVNVKNIYFGDANCGYFIAYPNPADNFVNIDILKEKNSSEDYSSSNCSIDVVDKSGIIKSQFTFKGFPYKLETTNLPDGLYFIIIQMKNTKSTLRVTIKH